MIQIPTIIAKRRNIRSEKVKVQGRGVNMNNNHRKEQLIIPLADILGAKLGEALERGRQRTLFNRRRQKTKERRATSKDNSSTTNKKS